MVHRLRNEQIREILGVIELGAKLREARLRWMGHVCPKGGQLCWKKSGKTSDWKKDERKTEEKMV